MAVMEAQQWCEKPDNREESRRSARSASGSTARSKTSPIASRASSITAPARWSESPHIMRFWADQASYPFQSHDLWFLTEDIRWGKYEAGFDTRALIARSTAKTSGKSCQGTRRRRCRHSGLQVAGQGGLLRRQGVRSENPAAYLKSLSIKRVEV